MDFEKAFEQFIDGKEYETAENALFSIVRIAFKAGWLAAKREPTLAPRLFAASAQEENAGGSR